MSMPNFKIYGAKEIEHWIEKNINQVVEIIEDVYIKNSSKQTINPDSYFLRYPNSKNRIIALPASIEDEHSISGIKWISSFPENISLGLDRASAVFIANDRKTGYPIACLEGSLISSLRTAASALIGAKYLHPNGNTIEQLGVIGCGLIAFNTIKLMKQYGWNIKKISLTDLSNERSKFFKSKIKDFSPSIIIEDLEETVSSSDMILFATSAAVPYFDNDLYLKHKPTVLHMSLRDISPEIILQSQNVADDIDHSVKAQTSLHLAEQILNNRDFITESISDFITKKAKIDTNKTRVYSPFGMGILDLAIVRAILEEETATTEISNFFPQPYVE
ncbi:2,3-diaminopropionate biosynthesis protein SbnB [Acinetobacter pittii]|uniref:2,3-diaminopropionate biosynthesis protein SbnB n=1 Tax=Acinetobacter pittii TaxID=48296 RepID=UPI00355C6A4C